MCYKCHLPYKEFSTEKHAGILWQTWACGEKNFQTFSLSKGIEKNFFNIPKKSLILGKKFQILFFSGKKGKSEQFF